MKKLTLEIEQRTRGQDNDHILGDSDYTAQYILEASPRYTEGGGNWYHTSTAPFNWTITPENGTTTFAPVTGANNPPDSGNDVLVGEAENDTRYEDERRVQA